MHIHNGKTKDVSTRDTSNDGPELARSQRYYAALRAARSMPRSSRNPLVALSPRGFNMLMVVTMPISTVVLTIAAIQATGEQRTSMICGATGAAFIGGWAHALFWRRRAAMRYLSKIGLNQ